MVPYAGLAETSLLIATESRESTLRGMPWESSQS